MLVCAEDFFYKNYFENFAPSNLIGFIFSKFVAITATLELLLKEFLIVVMISNDQETNCKKFLASLNYYIN